MKLGPSSVTPPSICHPTPRFEATFASELANLSSRDRHVVMVYIALGVLAISITVSVYSYGRQKVRPGAPSSSSKDTWNTPSLETDARIEKDAKVLKGNEREQVQRLPDRDGLGSTSIERGSRELPQISPATNPQAGTQVLQHNDVPSVLLCEDNSKTTSEESQHDESRSRKETPLRQMPQRRNQASPAAQSSMPPPPTSTMRRKPVSSVSSLMPPPSRPPGAINRLPGNPSSTLLPPPSAAPSLRTPSSRSLAPTSSSLPPSSRPSKKVLLAPGHSPLDWAHLVNNPPNPTFLRGANVPSSLIRVPPSMLKFHNGRKGRDAWGVWQGKVYNMSPYKDFHPGGVDQLMRGAGKEGAEKLFLEIHPWVSWESMLSECLVGILVGEEEGKEDGKMEEMD